MMRLPDFAGECPHIVDQIVPLNGGRFNLDLYLRVLRAKAQQDIGVIRPGTVGRIVLGAPDD